MFPEACQLMGPAGVEHTRAWMKWHTPGPGPDDFGGCVVSSSSIAGALGLYPDAFKDAGPAGFVLKRAQYFAKKNKLPMPDVRGAPDVTAGPGRSQAMMKGSDPETESLITDMFTLQTGIPTTRGRIMTRPGTNHVASVDAFAKLVPHPGTVLPWSGARAGPSSSVDTPVEIKCMYNPPRDRGGIGPTPAPWYLVQLLWHMYVTGARVGLLVVAYVPRSEWVSDHNAAVVRAWADHRRSQGKAESDMRVWTVYRNKETNALIDSVVHIIDKLTNVAASLVLGYVAPDIRAVRAAARSTILGNPACSLSKTLTQNSFATWVSRFDSSVFQTRDFFTGDLMPPPRHIETEEDNVERLVPLSHRPVGPPARKHPRKPAFKEVPRAPPGILQAFLAWPTDIIRKLERAAAHGKL